MPKENVFAIMWDCNGLEAVEQIPDPALATFAVLQNKEPPTMPNINMWKLRARFNTQRNYEIYIVHATPEITQADIREMFEANPQTAADTIRRLGHKFYSDRATQPRAIV
jgi:predicted HTH transcriptional regulator